MNTKVTGLIAACGLALALIPGVVLSAEPQQGWSPTQLEVWKTIVAWNDAFGRNDPEAYFKFVDAGITVITPGNPFRVSGIADDREEFEFSLNKGFSRVGYFQEFDPHVALYGDAAIVTYYSRGYYGTDKGATSYYKETDVLVKRVGGWKIVHIHLSSAAQ